MAEGVLAEIVARKRTDVAVRLAGVTLADLRQNAQPTSLSLRSALARPGARFVMEVKRASPSQGTLRQAADPALIASAYHGAADAISVLTDTPYFGGSLEDLRAVRKVFPGPILAKDFVVDSRQVVEARLHGADAVLAMLSVLTDAEAADVIAEAERLGMDALVETHDESEMERALALGARLIGINNRSLATLKVDLATTERLAHLVPTDRVLVCESGINDRADVVRLSDRVDAFLVGSSLMRADDPALAARALAFGRVKTCGITSVGDALMAARHGASFMGVIMVPGTPRAVTRSRAEAIRDGLNLPLVGVFRNEKIGEVASTARALSLHAVQLHGEEDAQYIRALRNLLPAESEIWAAGAVGETVAEPRLGADRTLYDTKVGASTGGTGVAFDWSRIKGRADLDRALLAGGLNPGNARAAASIGAYALDVGSGVEAAPGRKDEDKVSAFFEALRHTARGELATC